jgi:hypothetical protein
MWRISAIKKVNGNGSGLSTGNFEVQEETAVDGEFQ